jgi:hypothetical protein
MKGEFNPIRHQFSDGDLRLLLVDGLNLNYLAFLSILAVRQLERRSFHIG